MASSTNRWKMYLVMFMALAIAYAAYAMWSYLNKREAFEDESTSSDDATATTKKDDAPKSKSTSVDAASPQPADDKYGNRMFVISLFNTVLHRKPTQEEIDKYSVVGSEAQIMSRIVKDFHVMIGDDIDDQCNDDNDDDDDDDDDASKPKLKPPTKPMPKPKQQKPITQPTPPVGKPEPEPHCPISVPMEAVDGNSQHSNRTGRAEACTDDHRVCLHKNDVMARLNAISSEVQQFAKLVSML